MSFVVRCRCAWLSLEHCRRGTAPFIPCRGVRLQKAAAQAKAPVASSIVASVPKVDTSRLEEQLRAQTSAAEAAQAHARQLEHDLQTAAARNDNLIEDVRNAERKIENLARQLSESVNEKVTRPLGTASLVAWLWCTPNQPSVGCLVFFFMQDVIIADVSAKHMEALTPLLAVHFAAIADAMAPLQAMIALPATAQLSTSTTWQPQWFPAFQSSQRPALAFAALASTAGDVSGFRGTIEVLMQVRALPIHTPTPSLSLHPSCCCVLV